VQIVRERCQAAADAGDAEALQRLAKIMTKIGLGDQALTLFTDFIAVRLQSDTEGKVQALKGVVAMGAKGANVALFADCLTKVLECVAKAVEETEQLLEQKKTPLNLQSLPKAIFSYVSVSKP
jgi:hypothetical protein